MCTMSDTVVMTINIITDMGSSMMPMLKLSPFTKKGSHVKLYGMSVGNTPSAVRGVWKKYSKAV